VSTRSIPGDEVAATSMSDVHVRELFDAASALAEDDRKQAASDDEVVAWIGKQVGERGLTIMADELTRLMQRFDEFAHGCAGFG
jgi:hypothetical protein